MPCFIFVLRTLLWANIAKNSKNAGDVDGIHIAMHNPGGSKAASIQRRHGQTAEAVVGRTSGVATDTTRGGEATRGAGDDTWRFNHPHVARGTRHSSNQFAECYELPLLANDNYGALTQLESGALTQNGALTQYVSGALTQTNYTSESHLLANSRARAGVSAAGSADSRATAAPTTYSLSAKSREMAL